MRYEYSTKTLIVPAPEPSSGGDDVLPAMRDMGEQGWQLVAAWPVHPGSIKVVCIFMREKPRQTAYQDIVAGKTPR